MITKNNKNKTSTITIAASNSKKPWKADYVCDGVNDEGTINAAINALPSIGGKIVLSEGTFNITPSSDFYVSSYAGIVIDKPNADITIEGMGRSTKLIFPTGIEHSSFVIGAENPLNSLKITDMYFDCYGRGSTAGADWICGVFIYDESEQGSVYDVTIRDCTFYDSKDCAIYGDGTTGQRLFVNNNTFLGGSGYVSKGVSCHNDFKYSIIEGNIFKDCKQGIFLDTVNYVTVTGNIIYDYTQVGIYLYDDVNRCLITNNFITSTKTGGCEMIYIGDKASPASTSDYNVILNNYIYGQKASTNAMNVVRGTYNKFIGNVLEGIEDARKALDTGSNNIFKDNYGHITTNNGAATVVDDATYVDVTHGLNVTPTVNQVSITPTNNLGDASYYWISDVGASTFRINVDSDPGATTATFAWQIN